MSEWTSGARRHPLDLPPPPSPASAGSRSGGARTATRDRGRVELALPSLHIPALARAQLERSSGRYRALFTWMAAAEYLNKASVHVQWPLSGAAMLDVQGGGATMRSSPAPPLHSRATAMAPLPSTWRMSSSSVLDSLTTILCQQFAVFYLGKKEFQVLFVNLCLEMTLRVNDQR